MTDSLEEDLRLISACLAEDREASESFVRRFSGLIYYSVRHVLASRGIPFCSEDLEDLHNAIFLHLFENRCRKMGQYEGRNGCRLASWLRVVAVRFVLNHLRDSGAHCSPWQDKPIPFEKLSDEDREALGPLELMERVEQRQSLYNAIELLSPRDRLFMKLYFEDGLGLEAVASAIRISIQNAYTIKHRAIQRLRSHLSRDI